MRNHGKTISNLLILYFIIIGFIDLQETYFQGSHSDKSTGSRKPSRGKLWDRYTNAAKSQDHRKSEKRARSPLTGHCSPAPAAKSLCEDETYINEMETSRSFLLYNCEKSEAVQTHWETSYAYRLKYFKTTNDDIPDALQSWPIITKPIGVELVSVFEYSFKNTCTLFYFLQINYDFEQLYNTEKSNMLTSNFAEFKRKSLPLQIAALKKSSVSNKADKIERLQALHKVDSQTGDFLHLYYLPVYIKPTKHIKLAGDKTCKPSVVESQNSFIRLVPVIFLYTIS